MSAYYDQIPLKRPSVPTERGMSAFERALIAGTVILHADGKITGTFNAAIGKELKDLGGIYSGDLGVWFLRPMMIPTKLRKLAQKVKEADAGWIANLQAAAVKAAPVTLVAAVALPLIYRAIAMQVGKDISATTGRSVIPPTNYDEANVFAMTVEDSVRGFSEKETKRIGAIIRQSVAEEWPGGRLEQTLAGRVAMSADKAKFIARQGTAIAATDLKSQMYQQAGLPKYVWHTQGDDRVRSDHAVLDGQVFEWATPPVVNTATGLRAHPGQDFRCRCEAWPVEEYE